MSSRSEGICPAPPYTLLPTHSELSFPSLAGPLPNPLPNIYPLTVQNLSSSLGNPFGTSGFSTRTSTPSHTSSFTLGSAKTSLMAVPSTTTERELPCPTYHPTCQLRGLSLCPSPQSHLQLSTTHRPHLSCCPHLSVASASAPVTRSPTTPDPSTRTTPSPLAPPSTSLKEPDSTSPRPFKLARDYARLFGDKKKLIGWKGRRMRND
jgi:hypothetical protein